MHTRRGRQSNLISIKTTKQRSEIMESLLLHLLTDKFASALRHFWKLKHFDLEDLWFALGWGNSRTYFPIHDLANDLDPDLAKVLPAIPSPLDVIQLAQLVQKAELSGKELIVNTYCTHLAGMHWVMKWLLTLRSFS